MSQDISGNSNRAIQEIYNKDKVLIGVIHCPPLPGAPRYTGGSLDRIYDRVAGDAEAYLSGGLDGLIIENHGDIPFLKPDEIGHETTTAMAVLAERVRNAFGVPFGINVLANAAIPALAIAKASGAAFVRVNQWANAYVANEGIVEGEAARALRYRSLIGANDVKIFADAHVKHGAHAIVADRSIEELVRDVEFFDADAVIATGQRTGNTATGAEIDTIRSATRLPVLVGSGVTADNVVDILSRIDGVIIASSLKQGGVWWNPVERARVETFVAAAAPAME